MHGDLRISLLLYDGKDIRNIIYYSIAHNYEAHAMINGGVLYRKLFFGKSKDITKANICGRKSRK